MWQRGSYVSSTTWCLSRAYEQLDGGLMLDLDGEKERGLDTPHIPGIHLNLLQLLNSTKCVKLRIKWGKSQNLNAQPKKVKIVFFPLQYFTSVDFKKKIASTLGSQVERGQPVTEAGRCHIHIYLVPTNSR